MYIFRNIDKVVYSIDRAINVRNYKPRARRSVKKSLTRDRFVAPDTYAPAQYNTRIHVVSMCRGHLLDVTLRKSQVIFLPPLWASWDWFLPFKGASTASDLAGPLHGGDVGDGRDLLQGGEKEKTREAPGGEPRSVVWHARTSRVHLSVRFSSGHSSGCEAAAGPIPTWTAGNEKKRRRNIIF